MPIFYDNNLSTTQTNTHQLTDGSTDKQLAESLKNGDETLLKNHHVTSSRSSSHQLTDES